MKDYEFTLKFSLSDNNINSEIHIERLEEKCNDALIGIGRKGSIGLNFNRHSDSAYNAITSAIVDVKKAIPEAKLIEVLSEFVGAD